MEGVVEVGTPLCIPSKKFLEVGRVSAIRIVGETDPQPVTQATHGNTVILKIEMSQAGSQSKSERRIVYGRDFDYTNKLYSKISTYSQLRSHWLTDDTPFMRGFKKVFGFKSRNNE